MGVRASLPSHLSTWTLYYTCTRDLCPQSCAYLPSGTLKKLPTAHQPTPRMWEKEEVPWFEKQAQAGAAPPGPRTHFFSETEPEGSDDFWNQESQPHRLPDPRLTA